MLNQSGEQLPADQLSKVETPSEVQRFPGIEALRRVSDFFLDLQYKMEAATSAWNTTISGMVGRLLGRIVKSSSTPAEAVEDFTALYKRELESQRQHGRAYITEVREAEDRAWDRLEPYDFSSSEVVRGVKAVGEGAKAGYQQVMAVAEKIDAGVDAVARKVGAKLVESRGAFHDARTQVRVEGTAVAQIGDPNWIWVAYVERFYQLPLEERNAEYAALSPEAKVRFDAAYHRQYAEAIRQLQGVQKGKN